MLVDVWIRDDCSPCPLCHSVAPVLALPLYYFFRPLLFPFRDWRKRPQRFSCSLLLRYFSFSHPPFGDGENGRNAFSCFRLPSSLLRV